MITDFLPRSACDPSSIAGPGGAALKFIRPFGSLPSLGRCGFPLPPFVSLPLQHLTPSHLQGARLSRILTSPPARVIPFRWSNVASDYVMFLSRPNKTLLNLGYKCALPREAYTKGG